MLDYSVKLLEVFFTEVWKYVRLERIIVTVLNPAEVSEAVDY